MFRISFTSTSRAGVFASLPAFLFVSLLVSLFALLITSLLVQPAFAQAPDRISNIRTPWSNVVQPEWLQQVFPEAERFSDKQGEPPVYSAYRSNPETSAEELLGYVFLSADVPPEEKGYSAPVAMLVGLRVDNTLTGIKVLNYTESFRYSLGDFVADEPYQAQFRDKSITDEFKLTRDIDGLSGATLTSFGMTRGVRNAARRVATAYLDFEEGDALARDWEENAREQLDLLSWQDMLDSGMVKTITIPMPVQTDLQLTITYIGRRVIGEFFIGSDDYTRAERDASARLGSGEMMLLAVGGSAAAQYRQDRLSLQQGDEPARRVQQNRFVTAGNADEGMIAGRATYAGAIAMDEDFDITQPFTVIYRPPGVTESVTIDYELAGIGLQLARNEPILSLQEIAYNERVAAGFFAQLAYGPPWMNSPEADAPWRDMPWGKILMLAIILTLVMTAFLRKSGPLRWATLTLTLVYLGFIDGGFLSVSHITATIAQGPTTFLSNLPVLLIVTFTIVTTLLWGRVFCSTLCPFGAVQDFITRFSPKNWQIRVPQWIHDRALYIKYAILALIVGTALANSNISIFQYFEPFGTLFYFSSSFVLWGILLLILIACLVIERFYCRYVCPLGAALGVMSLLSPFRIARVPQCNVCSLCEHACPTGAIRGPAIDFKECVRCDICENKLITKAGSCRHSMAEIDRRFKGKGNVSVISSSNNRAQG